MPTQDRDRGLMGWWRAGTPEGRRALVAGSLGWMLDSFDVMLYALVLAALMKDLGMAKFTAGLLGSVTLVASAVGGLVFGVVADRYGRTRALICEHSHLLGVHRRVRSRADRGAARRVPGVPRARHGGRVGERRGAGLRDLVGRAPRQGARLHAERVGRRLRPRGARRGGGHAHLGLARRVLRRRAAGAADGLDPAAGRGTSPVAREAGDGIGQAGPADRRVPRRPRAADRRGHAHERLHDVRVVGVQPVDPGLPVAAGRRRGHRPRPRARCRASSSRCRWACGSAT